eukprot:1938764-Amphidinium_carterae.1
MKQSSYRAGGHLNHVPNGPTQKFENIDPERLNHTSSMLRGPKACGTLNHCVTFAYLHRVVKSPHGQLSFYQHT